MRNVFVDSVCVCVCYLGYWVFEEYHTRRRSSAGSWEPLWSRHRWGWTRGSCSEHISAELSIWPDPARPRLPDTSRSPRPRPGKTHTDQSRSRSLPYSGLRISITHLKDGVFLFLLGCVTRGVFPWDLEAFGLAVQPDQTGKRPVVHLRHQPGLEPDTTRMRRHDELL